MTTIGILGAGQLGRMLALAAYPLGFELRCFDPTPNSPAAPLAPQTVASFDDASALAAFASGCDVVTYEFENVPLAAAAQIAAIVPVFPPPIALAIGQDRIEEKRFFQQLGCAVPQFAAVATRDELALAIAAIGYPAVLKTRRLGYDGKSQATVRDVAQLEAAWATLGGQPLILEAFIPFSRELSILAARGRDGAVVCYAPVQNEHRDGILRRSIAPAPGCPPDLLLQCERIATVALDALGYVGLLAIETFAVPKAAPGRVTAAAGDRIGGETQLVINEMAPRVHNSGHWTIEAAETSQFENHIRAVAGLPLGSAALRGAASMHNLIGFIPDQAAILAIDGAHLHLYGKAARPGRKLGHITLRADDVPQLAASVARLPDLG